MWTNTQPAATRQRLPGQFSDKHKLSGEKLSVMSDVGTGSWLSIDVMMGYMFVGVDTRGKSSNNRNVGFFSETMKGRSFEVCMLLHLHSPRLLGLVTVTPQCQGHSSASGTAKIESQCSLAKFLFCRFQSLYDSDLLHAPSHLQTQKEKASLVNSPCNKGDNILCLQ